MVKLPIVDNKPVLIIPPVITEESINSMVINIFVHCSAR